MPVTLEAIRRSLLRESILGKLEDGPVSTVTKLAEVLQSPRPSVSRKLQQMKLDGEVERSGSGWALTDHGRALTTALRAEREAQLTRTAQAFGRNMQGLTNSLRNPLLASEALEAFSESSPISTALRHLPDMVMAIQRAQPGLVSQLEPFLQAAGAESVRIGNQMASVVEGISNPAWTTGAAAALESINSLGTSGTLAAFSMSMIDDTVTSIIGTQGTIMTLAPAFAGSAAAALASATRMSGLLGQAVSESMGMARMMSRWVSELSKPMPWLDGLWLPASDVVDAYAQWIDGYAITPVSPSGREALGDSAPAAKQPENREELEAATLSVSATLRVSRLLIEVRLSDEQRGAIEFVPAGPLVASLGDNESLDRLLRMVDPFIAELRVAAWERITSSGSDRVRQAASSYRQVIAWLFERIMPTYDLAEHNPKGETSPSLAGRVRAVLKLTGAESSMINKMGGAIASQHVEMSGLIKRPTTEVDVDVAMAHFLTTDGLLWLILIRWARADWRPFEA